MTPEQIKTQTAKLKKACKKTPLVLSSASGQGVQEALRALVKVIGPAARGDRGRAGAKEEEAWHP